MATADRTRSSKPSTTGVAGAAAASDAGRRSSVRSRILPRSVLGIASLILAFAIGAGFSGVVLFSYYQYKLNQTNDRVNTLISGYKTQFANAEGNLSATAAAAKLNIQTELKPCNNSRPGRPPWPRCQAARPIGVLRAHPRRQRAAIGRDRLRGVLQQLPILAADFLHHRGGGHEHSRADGVCPAGQHQHAGDGPLVGPEYDLALLVLPTGDFPLSRPPRLRRPHNQATGSTRCRGSERRAPRSPRGRSSTCRRAG
jgi:hypothetical protein